MKHYEKPTVEMYSLCGNETICGGCVYRLKDDWITNQLIADSFPETDPDNDGALSKAEVNKLFGEGEGCATTLINYCKFTSTGKGSLSWS